VAYSTPQAAYEQIIAAFNATTQGKKITFTQSYGASGDQSRAVVAGLDADYVAFSLEPDVTRLVKEKIVADDWNSDSTKQCHRLGRSARRAQGQPEAHHWVADLTKPGIEVITATRSRPVVLVGT